MTRLYFHGSYIYCSVLCVFHEACELAVPICEGCWLSCQSEITRKWAIVRHWVHDLFMFASLFHGRDSQNKSCNVWTIVIVNTVSSKFQLHRVDENHFRSIKSFRTGLTDCQSCCLHYSFCSGHYRKLCTSHGINSKVSSSSGLIILCTVQSFPPRIKSCSAALWLTVAGKWLGTIRSESKTSSQVLHENILFNSIRSTCETHCKRASWVRRNYARMCQYINFVFKECIEQQKNSSRVD